MSAEDRENRQCRECCKFPVLQDVRPAQNLVDLQLSPFTLRVLRAVKDWHWQLELRRQNALPFMEIAFFSMAPPSAPGAMKIQLFQCFRCGIENMKMSLSPYYSFHSFICSLVHAIIQNSHTVRIIFFMRRDWLVDWCQSFNSGNREIRPTVQYLQ